MKISGAQVSKLPGLVARSSFYVLNRASMNSLQVSVAVFCFTVRRATCHLATLVRFSGVFVSCLRNRALVITGTVGLNPL